ncbi:MAG: serine/threonine-protein phosphatase, partial [Clostridiales bacterium]|nr:serine/threonine-protein phosphatase [Clostridiales bacterium]
AEFLDATGLPIGMMADATYEYHIKDYDTGDLLVFTTDGLSDAFYKENPEEFSTRFKDVLSDAHTLDDPQEIIEMILNSFYNYNALENEKFEMDDVSLILCKL